MAFVRLVDQQAWSLDSADACMHLKDILRCTVRLLSQKSQGQLIFSICTVTLGKLHPLPHNDPLRHLHAELATTILDSITWFASESVLRSLVHSHHGVNPVVALAQLAMEMDPSCMDAYEPDRHVHSFVRELLAMSTLDATLEGRPTPGSIATAGVGAARLAVFERLEPTITDSIALHSHVARTVATSVVPSPPPVPHTAVGMGASIPEDLIGARVAPAPHAAVPPLKPGEHTIIKMQMFPTQGTSIIRRAARPSPRGDRTLASETDATEMTDPVLDAVSHTALDVVGSKEHHESNTRE